MKPFETLASVRTADGGVLSLHRRDQDYFIQLDGEELMSTRRSRSETALGEMVWRELRADGRPTVLVGGLGLGYTLRAVLERLPPAGRVVVAELFPAVVEWSRKYLDATAVALADPRVEVVERDVGSVIDDGVGRFDAILLDVDNGPSAWCLESNSRLYESRGLAAIRRALKRPGLLGIWSAYPDPGFVSRLRSSGFRARTETVRARGSKGARHTIFVATAVGPST